MMQFGGTVNANQRPKVSMSRRGRATPRATRVSVLCAALVLSLFGGTTVAVSASSAESTSAASTPKPNYAYYVGKTITWINPGKAGGGSDVFARVLAPLVASYLHCNVNVEDFSSVTQGQNTAGAAAPDGLTIGTLQINVDVDNDVIGLGGLAFSIQKEQIIAATPTNDGIIAVSPSYGVHTFKELLHSKTVVAFTDETPGGTDLEARLLLGAYRVNARLVTGYTSNADVTTGFLRGDAPGIINGYSTLEGPILAGQARVIMQTNPLVKGAGGYSVMKKYPSVEEFAKANPPATALGKEAIKELIKIVSGPNMTVTAPTGTPNDLVLALTHAIHSALAQPAARTELLQVGVNPLYISPEAARADISYIFNHQSVIEKELTLGV